MPNDPFRSGKPAGATRNPLVHAFTWEQIMLKETLTPGDSTYDLLHAVPSDSPLAIQKLLSALQALVAKSKLESHSKPRKAARAKQAWPIVGLGRSSFFAKQNVKDPGWDPTFPRSFKLGPSPRSPTVWFVDELEAWLESRAASREL
jgi:predicted DNA-binding transcriptional regulator AlpA